MTGSRDVGDPHPPAGGRAATTIGELFARLPEGFSEVTYRNGRWAVTRTRGHAGQVEKIWAEELGGRGTVSANLYVLASGERFRPCEMPAADVVDFLTNWTPSPRP